MHILFLLLKSATNKLNIVAYYKWNRYKLSIICETCNIKNNIFNSLIAITEKYNVFNAI